MPFIALEITAHGCTQLDLGAPPVATPEQIHAALEAHDEVYGSSYMDSWPQTEHATLELRESQESSSAPNMRGERVARALGSWEPIETPVLVMATTSTGYRSMTDEEVTQVTSWAEVEDAEEWCVVIHGSNAINLVTRDEATAIADNFDGFATPLTVSLRHCEATFNLIEDSLTKRNVLGLTALTCAGLKNVSMVAGPVVLAALEPIPGRTWRHWNKEQAAHVAQRITALDTAIGNLASSLARLPRHPIVEGA